MRRSIGGVVLLAAALLIAAAIGVVWMQRVAFAPSTDASVTHSILRDDEIREQIATIVASADAALLRQSTVELSAFIDDIATIPDGAALMSGFVADAHGRLLGSVEEQVVISAIDQVNIVRNELVGEADPLTLPVQRVSAVAFLDAWLTWLAVGLVILGAVVAAVGLALRPERGETTFALAAFFAALAVALVACGYLVPLLVLPALSQDPWMGVFPSLANHYRNITLLLAGVSIVVAALIAVGTRKQRLRRQHSTPLNLGRYRQDHSWSR